jgi:hypothetical protein
MPLTVNVGLNRKASRDFQSAGVSINLSAELDMGLLGDPPRLQHEVAKVYAQASEAIDRQLASMGGQRGSGAGSGNGRVHGPLTVTEGSTTGSTTGSSMPHGSGRVHGPLTVTEGSSHGVVDEPHSTNQQPEPPGQPGGETVDPSSNTLDRHRQQSRHRHSLENHPLTRNGNGRGGPWTGHGSGHGNGHSNGYGGAVRPATESQLKALRSMCKRHRLDLDHEAHEEFGIESADHLDIRQASQLIDALKGRLQPAADGRGRSHA